MERARPAAWKARLNSTESWPIRDSSTASGRRLLDPLQDGVEAADVGRGLVEIDIGAADHLAALAGHRPRRQGVGHPRPDIIVADEIPAAQPVARAQPVERRQELTIRRHPETVDIVRRAAFVQRRVDVGHAPADRRRQGVAHVAGVHADDGIDPPGGDQVRRAPGDGRGLRAGIDEAEPERGAAARRGVDFGAGQFGAGAAGRAPDACRAARGYEDADPVRARHVLFGADSEPACPPTRILLQSGALAPRGFARAPFVGRALEGGADGLLR